MTVIVVEIIPVAVIELLWRLLACLLVCPHIAVISGDLPILMMMVMMMMMMVMMMMVMAMMRMMMIMTMMMMMMMMVRR